LLKVERIDVESPSHLTELRGRQTGLPGIEKCLQVLARARLDQQMAALATGDPGDWCRHRIVNLYREL